MTLAIASGFALQAFLLARATLRKDHWQKLAILSLLWCILPALLEVILLFFADWSPGDLSGFALFSFLIVVPFYGFLNARLLQAINEETVLFLSVAVLYLLSYQKFWHPGFAGILAVPLLALLLRKWKPESLLSPFLSYGLFLTLLLSVALLQFQRIYTTMALPESIQPGFLPLFMGSMLAMYLAFHLWFAAKFIMIGITCLRSRGRQLAGLLLQDKVRARHLPGLAVGLVVALQIILYASNHMANWIEPALLLEGSVLLLPQAMGFWIRRNSKSNSE